ncbi:MAG: hypothetical protein CSA18_01175 [Deltaproteobacteria bacterium]|nr:MAG: hypothetical protein CSA18_01175 [Deltaproteobacteria bacterium]
MTVSKDSEFIFFRSELNKTLQQYFKDAVDSSVLPKGINLEIPEIFCLILLVEREEEIKSITDSQRYTYDSFINELENLGIGSDKVFVDCINFLISQKFINKNAQELEPGEKAFKLVDFVNKIFPGMPGIHFVAYVIQTIEEISSGRKTLEEGKSFFYQTLKSRSSLKKDTKTGELKSVEKNTLKKESSGVSTRNMMQKLVELRKARMAEENKYLKKMEVKSVFSVPPKLKEIETEEKRAETIIDESENQNEKFENYSEENSDEKIHKDIKDSESEEKELESFDNLEESIEPDDNFSVKEADFVKKTDSENLKSSEKVIEISQESDSLPVNIDNNKLVEKESIEISSEENKGDENEENQSEKLLSDEDIAKKISAFEQELLMTCPVCKEGKVLEKSTEKGKIFYQCSNDFCHFISWSKPFYFQCPVCANPFLVEIILKDGSKGLNCPRATCDFMQKDQENPKSKEKPKKKKKIVRRVRRKK